MSGNDENSENEMVNVTFSFSEPTGDVNPFLYSESKNAAGEIERTLILHGMDEEKTIPYEVGDFCRIFVKLKGRVGSTITLNQKPISEPVVIKILEGHARGYPLRTPVESQGDDDA